MVNINSYDVVIIGGGISACVFASIHIRNGFNGRIAIIESGRSLGGRSSTRNSLSNKGWQLNHGSPNLNICNTTKNKLLKNFIQELLDKSIIQLDSSQLIELNEDSNFNAKVNSVFYNGNNYISSSSMSELSEKIISLNNFKNQIDFCFENFIIDLEFKNNHWLLTSKNGNKYKSNFLVCSSNLLLHKRCLDILKIHQIPIRKAIPINRENKIDSIINLVNNQGYIQRLTFLIYTNSSYSYKDNYLKKYRYFLLNNFLEDNFKFERIIFQKQKNNNLGIVIHTRNINLINDYLKSKNQYQFKKNLLLKFNKLFDKNPYINQLLDFEDISIMRWRASQPYGKGIPEYLQLCSNYKIGFCGDWFDTEGFGRIEGAILSALNLADKVNSLN